MPCSGIGVAFEIGTGPCVPRQQPSNSVHRQAMANAKADADQKCPAWCECEPRVTKHVCEQVNLGDLTFHVWIVIATCAGECH